MLHTQEMGRFNLVALDFETDEDDDEEEEGEDDEEESGGPGSSDGDLC